VGARAARSAVIAVIVASIAMLFYIVWAFRRMPKPFRWGSCAVIALVHDVFITVGIFSLLGLIAGVEIDALFITGLLTIVGYSINNIVVIFDRIRENKARGLSSDFALTVNSSIVETLGRCLNTSLTTLFVILALFLFGGATIHSFRPGVAPRRYHRHLRLYLHRRPASGGMGKGRVEFAAALG
jgi:preprotein translocase subunit SecF